LDKKTAGLKNVFYSFINFAKLQTFNVQQILIKNVFMKNAACATYSLVKWTGPTELSIIKMSGISSLSQAWVKESGVQHSLNLYWL
jgi:hypothetical protein